MRQSPLFGTPQRTPAMTRLPPSPDNATSNSTRTVPAFSLDSATPVHTNPSAGAPMSHSQQLQNRLRSVAKYSSFCPRALSCSDEMVTTPHGASNYNSSAEYIGYSSMGAIAGPRGVALFRVSRPHVPLLIFSHATNSLASSNSISSLAFQPSYGMKGGTPLRSSTTGSSIYLAAARGSGVLIWDASGHSSNPLLGRLLVDPVFEGVATSMNTSTHHITSIDWKTSLAPSSGSEPLLATTTSTSLSLWDLRALNSGSRLKPSLRFATSHKGASLVQAACSSTTDECATIDTSGVVSIYDIRMTERGRSSSGSPTGAFVAHEAGVGIQHLPIVQPVGLGESIGNSHHSAWVTWGIETYSTSAVVKVWSSASVSSPSAQESAAGNNVEDDCGLMSDEAGPSPSPHKIAIPESSVEYRMLGQYTKANIACARVCPSPVANSVMVVGYSIGNDTQGQESGWWAELLSIQSSSSQDTSLSTQLDQYLGPRQNFGLSPIVGFTGGCAGSTAEQKSLKTMLGNDKIGKLQAAELAFTSDIRGLSRADGGASDNISSDEDLVDVELILCCLSDTGVITTTAIPEALPKRDLIRKKDPRRPASPTKRARAGDFVLGSRSAFSDQTLVFPEGNEGSSLTDLAGLFSGTAAKSSADIFSHQKADVRFEKRSASPQKPFGLEDPSVEQTRRTDVSGFMPFDMDVPVQPAYSNVNTGNVSGLQIGVQGLPPNSMAINKADSQTRDTVAMMENIETDRIPCPSICGASFGVGNGKLVIFRNGEVKKMWDWYQTTDMIRLSNASGGQVDNNTVSTSTLLMSKTPDGPDEKDRVSTSYGPRSYKELKDMVSTAKEAQWGEVNDGSVAPDDAVSELENFFEEESSESGSSGTTEGDEDGDNDDEHDDTAIEGEDLKGQAGSEIYKRYFGSRSWKGNQIQNFKSMAFSTTSSRSLMPSIGPTSDMLSPYVTLVRCGGDLLNGQRIEFAARWKLGSWNQDVGDSQIFDARGAQLSPNGLSKLRLPHYRDLVPASPNGGHSFSRTRSDPTGSLSQSESPKKSRFHRQMDEPGVHGGHYTVRPNMEESMTFLKKLFSHQQESGTTFRTLVSPPDSPVILNQRHTSEGRSLRSRVQGVPLEQRTLDINKIQSANLGVHTLRRLQSKSSYEREELGEMNHLCQYNAEVCRDLGDREKENVWRLLAGTVRGRIDDDGNIFNGWGGIGGGALGVDMISHFFDYYEKLGDVQMLATMFCVLSGDHRQDQNDNRSYFVRKGRDEVYDTYIIRYAELLYAWGLLNTRAELNKHLKFPSKSHEFEFLSLSPDGGDFSRPGLKMTALCPTCDAEIHSQTTSFCQQCGNFAFRCSICDMPVRGLSTVCELCHHGGHLNHMVQWFSTQTVCPTGCGCQCKAFTRSIPIQQQLPVAGMRPDSELINGATGRFQHGE